MIVLKLKNFFHLKKLVNYAFSRYLNYRYSGIEKFMAFPHETQDRIFNYLIRKASRTAWGKKYGYEKIKSYSDFRTQVPVSVYDDLNPFIKRMMNGEKDVLWPGSIKMFAKSSGTTEDKSKYIPVSRENLKGCHIKGGWDASSILYRYNPASQVFASKGLILGGSLQPWPDNPDIMVGDVSALMISNIPAVGRPFVTPDIKTALLPDWNEKIPLLAQMASRENVAGFGGVPSWLLILFRRILDITGKRDLTEVWPGLEVFFHGGVNFTPYRKQFEALIPKDDFLYFNVYNSTEGYFAIQDKVGSKDDDMLLLLNSNVFYEFMPFQQLGNEYPDTFSLLDVETGVNYAIIVNSNAGLWRYMIGDTVEFTSLNPYRIRITGRTKHFINVFGEEVMVSNTDKAIDKALQKHDAIIEEYTVGPVFPEKDKKGGHQWIIEFVKEPADLKEFQKDLDLALQAANSDYEAKRYNSYVMDELKIIPAPKGTFYNWMKSRGKLGGQNKVPRLSNDRKYIDMLLEFVKKGND